MTTRSHYLLFHKRSTDWDSPLEYVIVITQGEYDIFVQAKLSMSVNNKDIIIMNVPGV